MFGHTLFAKKSRLSNTVFFIDFDGTLFTPDKKLTSAPFYNFQTRQIFQKYNIPFVVVTGRSTWNMKSDIETLLLGQAKPDAIIAGAGSIIYYRLENGQLALDTSWEKRMQQTPIQLHTGEKIFWNTEKIQAILSQFLPPSVSMHHQAAYTFLIRLYVSAMPVKKLLEVKKQIEAHFVKGMQVIFTEKLVQQNTPDIFSGNILLVPVTAGKDAAVKYALHLMDTNKQNKHSLIHAFCFGDATIDVPMLTIQSEPKKFTIHSYGVNLTPLAKSTLQAQAKSNPQLTIVESPHSPQAILEVARANFRSITKSPERAIITNQFSPAQNSIFRLLLQPFESFLDTLFDQTMTANQISFQGLTMVKQSIDLLYANHTTIFTRMKIWKLYTMGNITDIFDGIRARQTHTISHEGQLTDVFCDRAKEFYQLYKRAQYRLTSNQLQAYETLLTAMSCILPSIARAQAEFAGTIVKEQDSKGGSMFARTQKLFSSFFLESLGLHKESLAIDQRIYAANIATYQNRMATIKNPGNLISLLKDPATGGVRSKDSLNQATTESSIKQKAQERFFLLIHILQEENAVVEKILQTHPELLKKYEKEFKKNIASYLKINVAKEREHHNFSAYNLPIYL